MYIQLACNFSRADLGNIIYWYNCAFCMKLSTWSLDTIRSILLIDTLTFLHLLLISFGGMHAGGTRCDRYAGSLLGLPKIWDVLWLNAWEVPLWECHYKSLCFF